jgi:hypothetical protein
MGKVRNILLDTASTWSPGADAATTCNNFLSRVQMSLTNLPNAHHASITAGGMVVINRSFLLTLMSFVLTYLTILLKFVSK